MITQYHIDERDMMFNLKECPGISEIQKLSAFSDCEESTLDLIFDQSRNFCQKVLAPLLASSDREELRLEDGRVHLPEGIAELWAQYRELDMIGMNSDPDYGGAGLPHLFSIAMTEMECGSFVAFSMLPLLTRGAARLIMAFGDKTMKETYLERMFSGQWSGTMCLTEPHAGSDVGAGSTRAVAEGDHYKITGTKIFISWGEHDLTENIIHLVLARTPGAPAGTKGLSLFAVPKNRFDGEGRTTGPNDVVCGSIEHKMGIKASPTCVINFGTNDACIGYLVGKEGEGIRYMFQMMNEARIEVGLQGAAQGSAAYLSALDYARERIQGSILSSDGPRPAKIIEHPDVRRMLLKMRALAEGSRALLYHLVTYVDLAHHHPTESKRYQSLVNLMTPIGKSYGSDQGFRITEIAVQTLGGYGYCQEYPVEQYLRDCKISSIYEGTNGIQALDLVMRKILRDKGRALRIWIEDIQSLCADCADDRIQPLAESLLAASGKIVETTMRFGAQLAEGKADRVLYRATDFQEAMGHIMVGYFLLRQARTAVAALAKEPGKLDRRFYEQKLVTTRYFFETLIPPAVRQLETMRGASAAEDATF